MTDENQTGKIERKDLAGILQNHKSAILKDSQKKYDETSNRIDSYWHDLKYDAYQIDKICIVSQMRLSGWNMQKESILFSGMNIEAACYAYDNKNNQYKLFEFSRGETPEKAYDSLIKRLEGGQK
jgi:hypothetical protein